MGEDWEPLRERVAAEIDRLRVVPVLKLAGFAAMTTPLWWGMPHYRLAVCDLAETGALPPWPAGPDDLVERLLDEPLSLTPGDWEPFIGDGGRGGLLRQMAAV